MDVPHTVVRNGLACRAGGFTLIELMVTLSYRRHSRSRVWSLLFRALIRDTRTTTRINAIVGGIAMARATKRVFR